VKNLPSFRDPSQIVLRDGGHISGLAQKVVLLSNRCALAWSGAHIVARTVIRELAQIEESKGLTPAILADYIARNPIDAKAIALIAYFVDGDQLSIFEHDCHFYEEARFKVFYGGSGVGPFWQSMKSSVDRSDALPEGDPRPSALNTAFHVLAPLLSVEFFDDAFLQQGFGGGYEVVTLDSGRLTKIDRIAFVVWSGSYDRQTEYFRLSAPRAIALHDYVGSSLVIRTTIQDSGGTEQRMPPLNRRGLHIVGPIVGGVRDKDELVRCAKSLPIEPQWVCNVLAIADPERQGGGFIIDFSTAERAATRSVRFHGPELTLAINRSYADYVEKIYTDSL